MDRNHLSVEVRVNGRRLREYQHEGEIWVEGRKNSDFTIRIRNDGDIRVLAVPSVDGLSVMDGDEASFDSSGYVIGPRSHLDIPGWRLNNDQVAKFRFGKSNKSYAAKTGNPRNIGVIGVAVFNEKIIPIFNVIMSSSSGGQSRGSSHNFNHIHRGTSTTTHACEGVPTFSCASPPVAHGERTEQSTIGEIIPDSYKVEPSLGTEFGKKATHRVEITTFNKASTSPENTFKIRYADRQELVRRGVDLKQRVIAAKNPSAFPGEQNCKPPADWNG